MKTYTEKEVREIAHEAMDLGMQVRQDQLNGLGTGKSGREILEEVLAERFAIPKYRYFQEDDFYWRADTETDEVLCGDSEFGHRSVMTLQELLEEAGVAEIQHDPFASPKYRYFGDSHCAWRVDTAAEVVEIATSYDPEYTPSRCTLQCLLYSDAPELQHDPFA